MNWRGRPLTSHKVVVETIAATTTATGLSVQADLDTSSHPTGIKIPNRDMKALTDNGILHRHDFHGEWNYTIHPRNPTGPTRPNRTKLINHKDLDHTPPDNSCPTTVVAVRPSLNHIDPTPSLSTLPETPPAVLTTES